MFQPQNFVYQALGSASEAVLAARTRAGAAAEETLDSLLKGSGPQRFGRHWSKPWFLASHPSFEFADFSNLT